jgi:hypothetical protein
VMVVAMMILPRGQVGRYGQSSARPSHWSSRQVRW